MSVCFIVHLICGVRGLTTNHHRPSSTTKLNHISLRFTRYSFFLFFFIFGWLPHKIIVHKSHKPQCQKIKSTFSKAPHRRCSFAFLSFLAFVKFFTIFLYYAKIYYMYIVLCIFTGRLKRKTWCFDHLIYVAKVKYSLSL